MKNRTKATPARARGLNQAYRINVIERAIDVLRAFSRGRPELRLGEVAEAAGLTSSTALRILTTLRGQGLVMRDIQSGLYSLGYDLVALGEAAKAQSGLVELAGPSLRAIHEALDETVYLSIRSGDSRIDIEQLASRQSLRHVIDLGERKLLYIGAAGKTLLAGMNDAELTDYLARTKLESHGERTITSAEAMWADIRRIRRQGFAEGVMEGPSHSGGVAAPIVDALGRIVGSIAVIAPLSRYTQVLRKQIIALVCSAAEETSKRLGPRRRAVNE